MPSSGIVLLLITAFANSEAQTAGPDHRCDVRDPFSCDNRLFEVCLFVDGSYSCQCSPGYSRLPDGRCKSINECQDARLNDCSSDAQCIDTAESYSCQCNPGYVDVSNDPSLPGRLCRLVVDECSNPERFNVDCHSQAVCVDTADGYECRCQPGFVDVSEQINELPGRSCVQAIDECADASLNDCSVNADCQDAKVGFTCRCRDGYVDASGNGTAYPGRICTKPNDPASSTLRQFQLQSCEPGSLCAAGQTCSDEGQAPGQYVCQCQQGFTYFEGRCVATTACSGANDCDPSAVCSNVFNNFRCQCRPGYIDRSPDPLYRPGRVCQKLVNECASRGLNDCDALAECTDTREGYSCACPASYADVSSAYRLEPGRKCVNASNECAHKSLHSCDINADCVDTITGYECVCIPGFYDVSSSANLPSGRVCSVHTSCPQQPTDLLFLVDGSGSIGTLTFKNEVLRFVREFVELFEIGADNTRVGLMQYSERIRHEFDLGTFSDKAALLQGISDIDYMTGLTSTGLAITHMAQEAFSASRGARLAQNSVAKVAIVITDGRSQDEVSAPAERARQSGINLFVIGVTDHVNDRQLEQIAGQTDRYFHVRDFTDLNTKLRSVIQKAVCPGASGPEGPGDCDPITQAGCDRRFNEICVQRNNQQRPRCECPAGFKRHPLTKNCGGAQCNPNVPTTCKWPAVCKATPLGINLCSCPDPNLWDPVTGNCQSSAGAQRVCLAGTNEGCSANQTCQRQSDGEYKCECNEGLTLNADENRCVPLGWCNPSNPDDCDRFKREACLPSSQGHNKCQCPPHHRRHPVSNVCLIDECLAQRHDCDPNAMCTDLDDGYLCKCPAGFLDGSPDPVNRPGRVCEPNKNECVLGTHNCDANAKCTDLPDGFVCNCRAGFIDVSPNPRTESGISCRALNNECVNGQHDCHANATCEDTAEAFRCSCNAGFEDPDVLRNPGRNCVRSGIKCGSLICSRDLEEVCLTNPDRCGCRVGYARSTAGQKCIESVEFKLPILVARVNGDTLRWNSEYGNPDSANYVNIAKQFEQSIQQHVGKTSVRPSYITSNVVSINPPNSYNSAWQDGLMFNFSVSLTPNHGLADKCELWNRLVEAAKAANLRLGTGALYISPDQPNDCKPKCGSQVCDERLGEVCVDNRRCECPAGLRQAAPGQRCEKQNPCERDEWNECHVNAKCVNLPDGYACECLLGFKDVSAAGTRPGTTCGADFCFDVECPKNTTCKNTGLEGACECLDGFHDIRASKKRVSLGLEAIYCLRAPVPWCELGLTDCSTIANCTNLVDGYECRCPVGTLDASAAATGRVCVEPSGIVSCGDTCNKRGDCVHGNQTVDVSCACYDGYSGEFCEVAVGEVRLLAAIILAILFLLMTLCCLCYFCTKCRCIRGGALWYREPLFTYRKAHQWGTLDNSSGSESGAAFSGMSTLGKNFSLPRAKLDRDAGQMVGYLNQGAHDTASMASDYTVQEEIERHVVTTTTRRHHGDEVVQSGAAEATSSARANATTFSRASQGDTDDSQSIDSQPLSEIEEVPKY